MNLNIISQNQYNYIIKNYLIFMSNNKSIPNNQLFYPRRDRHEKVQSLTREDSLNKLSEDSSQFSFNKGLNDTGKMSIRDDLCKLPKEDIVQILLDQIEESKILRIKLSTMQEQFKIMGSFRQQSSDFDQSDQFISMTKYKQLADYMEQYINNTNEAQNHFTNIINELKINNKKLKQQSSDLSKIIQEKQKEEENTKKEKQQKDRVKQLQKIIGSLQESLTHYMNINNQQTRKYDKLKRMYEVLEQQLQLSLDQSQINGKLTQVLVSGKKNNESKEKDKENQKQILQERVKILQIQNHELKESWSAMEKACENKSEKIRKLLEQMEKLSQQKWIYKERYMQLKSKSLIYSHSSTKNSDFDTNAHSSGNIVDFNCEK